MKKIITYSIAVLLFAASAYAFNMGMDMGMSIKSHGSTAATSGFIWEDVGASTVFEDISATTYVFEDIN